MNRADVGLALVIERRSGNDVSGIVPRNIRDAGEGLPKPRCCVRIRTDHAAQNLPRRPREQQDASLAVSHNVIVARCNRDLADPVARHVADRRDDRPEIVTPAPFGVVNLQCLPCPVEPLVHPPVAVVIPTVTQLSHPGTYLRVGVATIAWGGNAVSVQIITFVEQYVAVVIQHVTDWLIWPPSSIRIGAFVAHAEAVTITILIH